MHRALGRVTPSSHLRTQPQNRGWLWQGEAQSFGTRGSWSREPGDHVSTHGMTVGLKICRAGSLGDLHWKAIRPHTGMREAPGDREGVRGPTDQEVGSLSSRETACTHILLTVGQAAVLAHGHGLLLDVILCEKPRLACHHLLNRCWDDHIINVVIRLPWLPLLGWDDLCGPRRVWVMQLPRVGDPRSPRLVLPHTGTTRPRQPWQPRR